LWARTEGCHEAQGFLFSQARPNAEIVGMLKAQSATDVSARADKATSTALVARGLSFIIWRARICAC
jgi:hypothetical protein